MADDHGRAVGAEVGDPHGEARDIDEAPQASLSEVEPTPSARDLGVEPERTLVVVDWLSFVHLALAVGALLAVHAIVGSATDSLTMVAIAAVLALALDTPVRALQDRGRSRGAAVAIVCLLVLAALGVVGALLGPPAVREAAGFGEDLPATLVETYDFPVVGDRLEEADIAARSEEWLAQLPGSITADTVSAAMDQAVAGIVSVLVVLVLTLALLLDGEVLVRRARSLAPAHLQPALDDAARLVDDTLGRYFAGSLLLAALSGTYVLTVGLVLGVPLILLAAVWVAITDLIPQVGGFLGGSVFVVLAATEGAVTGAVALGLFVAYMSAENYLIQPAVVGRTVDLSPPTTMLAAIIGGTAAGVPGALVATPMVGSAKALFLAARRPDGDDEDEGGDDGGDGDDGEDGEDGDDDEGGERG